MKINKKYISLILFFIYILLRFIYPAPLNAIAYGGLIFDILISLASIGIYWEGLSFINLVMNKKLMAIYFLSGGAVYCLAKYMQMNIPFGFESIESFALMVLIGPIIEELFFRLGLWKLIENFPFRFKYDSLIITSVIFSFSHFYAFFFINSGLHPFIFFQTFYTLLLGISLGLEFNKWRSLSTVSAHHMLFNLGFFTAYFWKYII